MGVLTTYLAYAVTLLTAAIGVAAIANAVRLNKAKHGQFRGSPCLAATAEQQFRLLRDVRGDPPRLVAGERLLCSSRIVEIDIAELLAAAVLDDEIGVAFFDLPRRRKASHCLRCPRDRFS
jgi:hypothetical protein